ncbi:SDR family oxidoreductase [Thermoleophilia bacterium SCSIO 60948]|nr:SDR family oxidoreductase [Thermoleophilia bacterium SCSIO 60948]
MAERAALVTGGSSGIGLAIARVLGEEGHAVTIAARGEERLKEAAEGLRADGIEVETVPTDALDVDALKALVERHRERWGRLDVLVNNAGVGLGGEIAGYPPKRIDVQLGVNLKATIVMTGEAMPMLLEAGEEHGRALIVNLASIAGKAGQAWLSVYSATKAGVVGFSQATQSEVGSRGVRVTALCPAFVDTPMTEFAREHVEQDAMIRPEDVSESVRFLLKTSRACVVPEIVFARPGEALL